MNATRRSWGIVAVGLFMTIVSVATAKYSGGSGTANDPYQIATAADLILLGETPADYGKHFIVTANIDLDPRLPGRKVFDKAVIAPDADPTKGDFQGASFSGVFDGKAHTIAHLTIKGDSYLGLFGQLGSGAQVKNLGLADVNIAGSGYPVGGLVGMSGTFIWPIGGTVSRCYSTGSVSGVGSVGGLVGWNYEGTVTQCYSTGAVNGNWQVGGLVGHNDYGTVTHCYSAGSVSGKSSVGGLVGLGRAERVTACFWDTQTSRQTTSAGGTGKTTAQMQTAKTFLDAGWDFVGETGNGVSNIWQMPQGGGYPVLAALNGYEQARLKGSGTPDDPYLISDPLELGAVVYYSPYAHYRLTASFDLSGIRWAAAVVPWFAGAFDGNGHTILHLTIKGESDLGLFGQLALGAEVKNLGMVDVDIAGSGYPVGALVGVSDGSLTNCYSTGSVSGKDIVGGLVGGNGGTVTQCYSSGVVAGGDYVGGLVGNNVPPWDTLAGGGIVTQCYSTGAVTGSDRVGGLVGNNGDFETGGGVVRECYSTASVGGKSSVGGLVGCTPYGGAVTQCYSTGAVSGSGEGVGGLVGASGGEMAEGYVRECYSTGAVSGSGKWVGGLVGAGFASNVTACFWNTQTSGQATSAGGAGKATAQMQDPDTFRTAGWDFVGDTDGPDDFWAEPQGGGYPILWWRLSPWPSLPKFSGGTGEPNDPYRISTAQDLNSIGYNPRLMKCHFKLVADLDLRGVHFYPIGDWYYPYGGVFDGNGHTISHLTIRGKDDAGLFGSLGRGAEVKDLSVADVNIIGTGRSVGGLVVFSGGSVIRCHSTGAVSGKSDVGGLVGWNYGTVTECYSTGAVSGTGDFIGGLVGWNAGGTVTRCYSTSAVSGWSVGGLVGANYSGSLAQCYSTGTVSGTSPVGGLVGANNSGSLAQCYSTGTVSGSKEVGGLVGSNPDGAVTQCYSTGAVSGVERVGALVGSGWPGGVLQSFWDKETSGQSASAGGVGLTTGEMMDPYMLGVNGFANDPNWVLDAGRDYPRLAWEGKPGSIIPKPQIDWLQGAGISADPYRVDTAAQLVMLGRASILWDRHVVLGADINLDPKLPNGEVFAHAVIPAFLGVFDGNDHTISHLTITGKDYVGLFGQLGSGAEVKNLGIVDANITGFGEDVGGLVGFNHSGSLIRCYSSGAVSGGGSVGGLVGWNGWSDTPGGVTQCYSTAVVSGTGSSVGGVVGDNHRGTVTRCSSAGAVSGKSHVGGLVGDNHGPVIQCYSTAMVSGTGSSVGGLAGWNGGTVTGCYSTGAVTGGWDVGGLVGGNYGSVTQCYSTGAVTGTSYVGGLAGRTAGSVAACFWDTQTSGQATSVGGAGRTTTQMQTAKTFLDAGWDFVGETKNGTADIWWILEGKDYPRLWWELIPGN